MATIEQDFNAFDQPKTTKTTKKRKWREIEQLKEKFQLEKELKQYDHSLEYMLEEF